MSHDASEYIYEGTGPVTVSFRNAVHQSPFSYSVEMLPVTTVVLEFRATESMVRSDYPSNLEDYDVKVRVTLTRKFVPGHYRYVGPPVTCRDKQETKWYIAPPWQIVRHGLGQSQLAERKNWERVDVTPHAV